MACPGQAAPAPGIPIQGAGCCLRGIRTGGQHEQGCGDDRSPHQGRFIRDDRPYPFLYPRPSEIVPVTVEIRSSNPDSTKISPNSFSTSPSALGCPWTCDGVPCEQAERQPRRIAPGYRLDGCPRSRAGLSRRRARARTEPSRYFLALKELNSMQSPKLRAAIALGAIAPLIPILVACDQAPESTRVAKVSPVSQPAEMAGAAPRSGPSNSAAAAREDRRKPRDRAVPPHRLPQSLRQRAPRRRNLSDRQHRLPQQRRRSPSPLRPHPPILTRNTTCPQWPTTIWKACDPAHGWAHGIARRYRPQATITISRMSKRTAPPPPESRRVRGRSGTPRDDQPRAQGSVCPAS